MKFILFKILGIVLIIAASLWTFFVVFILPQTIDKIKFVLAYHNVVYKYSYLLGTLLGLTVSFLFIFFSMRTGIRLLNRANNQTSGKFIENEIIDQQLEE